MSSHLVSRDINFTRSLFWSFLLLLFLVPLPLGSNRTLYWSVLVAAAAFIMLIWTTGLLIGIARLPHALERGKWPLILLLVFVCWAGVQFLPSHWLSPSVVPAYLYSAFSYTDGPARLSGDVYASADSLLLTLGLVLMATLTILLVRSRRRALQVLFTLVLAGLIQALYGSLMLLSGVEFGFLDAKQYGRGVATGTFINRNHYANLLLLSLSAGIGLLLAQMNLHGDLSMRQRVRSLLKAVLGPKARLRIYMIIMVIALVLTRSRMGNTAFFVALPLVGFLALWRLQQPSRPLLILVISVLVIDIVVVGTWFGMENVIDRIQLTVQVEKDDWLVHDRNRIDANREVLQIISLAPITGMGAGSFYTVYPGWRGIDQKFMDHGHNDYLEFTLEYGIAGFLLLGLFLIVCFHEALMGLKDGSRAKRFGVSFAAMMAMVTMLVHASVDFSLYIPANATWFMVLCILPFCVRRAKDQKK